MTTNLNELNTTGIATDEEILAWKQLNKPLTTMPPEIKAGIYRQLEEKTRCIELEVNKMLIDLGKSR